MEIQKIGVIGAGQMGSGIAQVAAQVDFSVVLLDMKEELVQKAYTVIDQNLSRSVTKGKLTAHEKELILGRICLTTDMEEVADSDIIIEAVIENMEIKQKVFRKLDQLAPWYTIFASNTSSLPITEIAAVTDRPDRFIGMHFMNPVPVMKLVEIIRGLATSDEVYEVIRQLTEKMGKTPVAVNDFPGFVSNRILVPMINEAIYVVYEGIASPEDVDRVMTLGMNHPMGPLTLADFAGLDTCLYVIETLYKGYGDSKYRPCPLLRKYVKAGWFGRKSGRGFFLYE